MCSEPVIRAPRAAGSRRTPRAATSGRASRARPGGSGAADLGQREVVDLEVAFIGDAHGGLPTVAVRGGGGSGVADQRRGPTRGSAVSALAKPVGRPGAAPLGLRHHCAGTLRQSSAPVPVGRRGATAVVDVGLEVDDPGDRHGRADPALGGVDGAGRRRAAVSSRRRRSWPRRAARPGPRCSVLQVDDPVDAASPASAALDPPHVLGGRRPRRAAGSSSRSPRTTATTTSSRPIATVPTPSQRPLPVTSVEADADQREAPGRSAQRCPRAARPAARAPWPGGRTATQRLSPRTCGRTRGSRCGTRSDSSPIATSRTTIGTHCQDVDRLGVLDLVDALVEREQAADAEQHDRRR